MSHLFNGRAEAPGWVGNPDRVGSGCAEVYETAEGAVVRSLLCRDCPVAARDFLTFYFSPEKAMAARQRMNESEAWNL